MNFYTAPFKPKNNHYEVGRKMSKKIVIQSVKRLSEVDIDGVRVKIKPPSLDEKDLFTGMIATGNAFSALKAGRMLVSMCLKEVLAPIYIEDEGGEEVKFELEFLDNGYLTDDTMEVLGQFPIWEKIRNATMQYMNGTPSEFYLELPNENSPGVLLEGVTLVKKKKVRKKK